MNSLPFSLIVVREFADEAWGVMQLESHCKGVSGRVFKLGIDLSYINTVVEIKRKANTAGSFFLFVTVNLLE